jgi:hypothetical protein
VRNDVAGEEIEGEVYLHSGSFAVSVAVPREGGGIGFWHDLTGSVFNEDALDFAALNGGDGGAIALLHEVAKHGHHEGRGVDVEAIMKRLTGHAERCSVFELAGDLIA